MLDLSSIDVKNNAEESLQSLLETIGAPEVLGRQKRILIKPNLINTSPPPVTVPVELVAALITLIRSWSDAEIVVAEGSGAPSVETSDAYEKLGYGAMAAELGVSLIDLNTAPLKTLRKAECEIFPEMHLPEILFDSFVISLAMLKAHSISDVTLAMKNMIGCAPPSHYQVGGHWKKSAFHRYMHESIFELNQYRAPDMCLIDARVGLADYHLGGATCNPPVGKFIAGFDPVAVDAMGAELLGFSWQDIGHIAMADGVLGNAAF